MHNLKFVALPVPEIIGGIRKKWAVPGYALLNKPINYFGTTLCLKKRVNFETV